MNWAIDILDSLVGFVDLLVLLGLPINCASSGWFLVIVISYSFYSLYSHKGIEFVLNIINLVCHSISKS